MFLIEKLPKESEKTVNESVSKVALLEKSVAAAISHGLSIPWLPHFCHKKGIRNRGRASTPYASVNIEVPVANAEDGNATLLTRSYLKLYYLHILSRNGERLKATSLYCRSQRLLHALFTSGA